MLTAFFNRQTRPKISWMKMLQFVLVISGILPTSALSTCWRGLSRLPRVTRELWLSQVPGVFCLLDANTGLWLVQTDHVTWTLACDWSMLGCGLVLPVLIVLGDSRAGQPPVTHRCSKTQWEYKQVNTTSTNVCKKGWHFFNIFISDQVQMLIFSSFILYVIIDI